MLDLPLKYQTGELRITSMIVPPHVLLHDGPLLSCLEPESLRQVACSSPALESCFRSQVP